MKIDPVQEPEQQICDYANANTHVQEINRIGEAYAALTSIVDPRGRYAAIMYLHDRILGEIQRSREVTAKDSHP